MNMIDSVMTCFHKYTDFSGRASRSEYWYFWLFNVIIELVISFSHVAALSLIMLFLVVPLLAVSARRLHDTNHSGWWMLCPIVNIVFYCTPSIQTP